MFKADNIYRKDAVEGLSSLGDNSVDLIISDPPYNIAAKNKLTLKEGKILSTLEVWGQWDQMNPFDYDVFIMRLLSEYYRVLKDGGAMYMFTAQQDNGHFIRQAKARGFTYQNQLAIVKKSPLPSFRKSNWRNAYELCMYLTKGKQETFNFLSQRECVNVFSYANGRRGTKHPTEKPLEFIKRLVQVSSNPGALVVDPFMGSGTTAVACQELDRHFIGFEINKSYIKIAKARLRIFNKLKQHGGKSPNA